MHDFIPAGEAISGPTTLISGSWGDTLLSSPPFTSFPTSFKTITLAVNAKAWHETGTGFCVRFNTLTRELCDVDEEDGTTCRLSEKRVKCRWVKMRFTTFRFYNQQVVIISPPVLTFRGAVTQAHGQGRRWGSAGLVFWAQSAVVGPCLWTFSADQHVESGTEAFNDRIHSDWLFRLSESEHEEEKRKGAKQ